MRIRPVVQLGDEHARRVARRRGQRGRQVEARGDAHGRRRVDCDEEHHTHREPDERPRPPPALTARPVQHRRGHHDHRDEHDASSTGSVRECTMMFMP
jgi:hypothetical protein